MHQSIRSLPTFYPDPITRSLPGLQSIPRGSYPLSITASSPLKFAVCPTCSLMVSLVSPRLPVSLPKAPHVKSLFCILISLVLKVQNPYTKDSRFRTKSLGLNIHPIDQIVESGIVSSAHCFQGSPGDQKHNNCKENNPKYQSR